MSAVTRMMSAVTRKIASPERMGLAMLVLIFATACTAVEPVPEPATDELAVEHRQSNHGHEGCAHACKPGGLFGLYQGVTEVRDTDTGDALPLMHDFLMLQPGGAGVAFSGEHNFGSFGAFPSNAVGSLITWKASKNKLETRLLRPLYVPTGGTPAQLYVGYLRGLFEYERTGEDTWEGTADVEVVQFVGPPGTLCLNEGLMSPPCVTRHYHGTSTIEQIDPWEQAGQPNVEHSPL